MTNPRYAVFDVGNVLLEWDPRHLYRKLFDQEAEMEHFLSQVWSYEQIVIGDKVPSLRAHLEELAEKHPDHAHHLVSYHARFLESIAGPIEVSVTALEALAEKGPVYGISNFAAETWEMARQAYPFLERFTDIIVSGQVGMLKPEAEIFHLLLERNGLKASDCLFIDDRLDNIEAAQAVGMAGHHFKDALALQEDLRQRGLL